MIRWGAARQSLTQAPREPKLPMSSITSPPAVRNSRTRMKVAVALLATVLLGAGGYGVNLALRHIEQLNDEIDGLEVAVRQRTEDTAAARRRAAAAEESARDATISSERAAEDAELARLEAANAGQRASVADQRAADAERASLDAQTEARLAREEAEETRRVAAEEMNRLNEALGRIADTRRTALGLVMSLDEAYLKFDFDQAVLRPESREILSRIAGILFTADDFAVTVSGHTDARGAETYNQRLSERRARSVADYLIEAGLPAELFTVEGLGKSQLLDSGRTEDAHARNRRVELGIVNVRLLNPSSTSLPQ